VTNLASRAVDLSIKSIDLSVYFAVKTIEAGYDPGEKSSVARENNSKKTADRLCLAEAADFT
jgi:hypothetical protein